MNTSTTDPLDSFDAALLAELRHEVSLRAAGAKPRRPRRRSVTLAGVAATALAAFGITSLGSPSAAYAVDASGGDITITIHRLDDAAGLERSLAAHGITADVNYEPLSSGSGLGVAPDGPALGTPGEVPEGGVVSGSASVAGGDAGVDAGGVPADGPCGDFDHPVLTADLQGDDYVISIPAGSPLHGADSELKITTSGDLADSVAGIAVNYTVDGVECGMGSMSASAVPAD